MTLYIITLSTFMTVGAILFFWLGNIVVSREY